MADSDLRKRLNYFTGLFLEEGDFKVEQKYHVEQQRQQTKLLFTPGIIDPENGLKITVAADKTKATISSGIAVDQEGRLLIVLADDSNRRDISLTSPTQEEKFLVISYQERTTDEKGGQGTRIFEEPRFELIPIDNPPSEDLKIRLARLTTGSGGIVGEPNLSVRKAAGVKVAGGLAGLKVDANEIRSPGGFIELLQSGAVTLTPNLATKQITIGESHSVLRNNPHVVTAAQVGALPLAGGGSVNGNVLVTGNTTVQGKLDVRTNNIAALTANPGAAFIWNNPRNASNASVPGYGLVARVTSTSTSLPGPTTVVGAAVVGISDIDNVNGVYATAKTGTLALLVDGTAQINGRLVPGHTVDTFINASGQQLRTGDIVKLKGTPVMRFRGQQNRIPLAEVTLADKENDPLVIGIVDCEAMPEMNAPDTRVQPEDPTFIENGGDL